MLWQAPEEPPPSGAAAELLGWLQELVWIDRTALAVLLVFFVIGLFKGLIWQTSRVAILVAAYALAGRFGEQLAALLAPAAEPGPAAVAGPAEPSEATLYLAYVLVFVAVLAALSLLALLLQKLIAKAGLGFFDRLGGGVLGIATGACVVLAMVLGLHMFCAKGSHLLQAAETSHSLRLSKRALDYLGARVPDEIRSVLALQPLHAPAAHPPGPSAQPAGPAAGPGTGSPPPPLGGR